MSLATYSRELKVFNAEDEYSTPVSVCVTNSQPTFGRITWSGDGKWLVVAPLDQGGGPLPIFKYSNKRLQPLKYITLSNIISASFFNWTNRNIAVGNQDGEIFVWDIKDRKTAVKMERFGSHPVDLLAVNSDDKYLASGSLNTNKICLHGLKTNKVVNTICIPKSKQTSSLKFCMCKKNYLGMSSIESTICIWDIMRSEFVFKNVNSHAGACTDISFSPINYDILAAVSLTKTLQIFDIREKKSILNANIGEPINCVDIILNGDKVTMGTTGGSIIIYDLRADKILNSFKAHSDPVLSIKTQSLKIAKSFNEVEMNTPDVIENPSKTLDISVMDVFSPIVKTSDRNFSPKNLSVHSKSTVPSQSTPIIVCNGTQPLSPANDSFLMKVFSPLSQQKSLCVMNASQSSPCLYPISEKPDLTEEETNMDLDKIIKKESSDLSSIRDGDAGHCDDGGGGDGFRVDNPIERNVYYSDIVNEIQMCQKSVLQEISLARKEINEIKNNFENRFKVLEDKYDSLRKLITEDVKQEIYVGNCNSKIDHSCHRILINELNESFLASMEKMSSEIQLNAFRLMHIYDVIKGTK